MENHIIRLVINFKKYFEINKLLIILIIARVKYQIIKKHFEINKLSIIVKIPRVKSQIIIVIIYFKKNLEINKFLTKIKVKIT